MQKLRNLAEKFVNIDVHYWINEITSDNHVKGILLKLNKEQLQKGQLSTGNILPHYSQVSQKVYGKADIPIQLYDTGEFYNSFDLTYRPKEVYFTADPLKYDEEGNQTNLFARYSVNVMGLTEENKEEYIEIIREGIMKKLRELI